MRASASSTAPIRAKLFADRIFTLLFASQLVLLAIALLFTPAVIGLLAPGFAKDPGRFALAVDLTRITFPYLLLISLVTLYGGILNALGRSRPRRRRRSCSTSRWSRRWRSRRSFRRRAMRRPGAC